MLHLQRASAGSGKTFALAKTFIRLLISTTESGSRRLRSLSEIPEAISEILAVTFTNKATGEMQQRIVEKLAALADADIPDTEAIARTDYLKDFMEEFGATRTAVAEVCAEALRHLLLSYSQFHVSTIDSFFQSILRTFAYETEINDSYALEIDNAYIVSVGLDSVLDSLTVNSGGQDTTEFWLKRMMADRSGGSKWNIFLRNEGRHTLYTTLRDNALNLEKEEFKTIRQKISHFFDHGGDRKLQTLFMTVDAHVARLLEKRRLAALELQQACSSASLHPSELAGGNHNTGRIKKALDTNNAEIFRPSVPKTEEAGCSLAAKKKKEKMQSIPPAALQRLDTSYLAFCRAAEEFNSFMEGDFMRLWKLYACNLPALVLLHIVEQKMRDFLESTGTVQISDTNTLLKRIVGTDEVSFIYERIGTRINHFLIDEFQDTSRMQWDIFEPLLQESMSYGHDNLIIGDAKQSIYRFRNADPSLITDTVPSEFEHDDCADPMPADGFDMARINTNWRSALRIVQFNNYIFHRLSQEFTGHIRRLYNNCVQPPSAKNLDAALGYAEISIIPANSASGDEDDDSPDDADTLFEGYRRIGPLIGKLLDRGIRMSDIGILVLQNDDGQKAIDAIMEYNASLPPGSTLVECISDQSLKVEESSAVRIIISALRALCEGSRNNDIPYKRSAQDYPMKHAIDAEILSATVSRLQTLALPILVESLTEAFVSEEIRRSEARYIAAFLDAVLEYCETYNTDIASFLAWWERKRHVLAVTSPDDADAVRILTIHKAKGLEYKCVIIPDAKFMFGPAASKKKPEWVWSIPDTTSIARYADEAGIDISEDSLPSVLPLPTIKKLLEGTPHSAIWRDYKQSVCQDSLNLAYVALTRAEYELYIFCPDRKERLLAPAEDDEGNPVEDVAASMSGYLERYSLDSADFIESNSIPWLIDSALQPLHDIPASDTDQDDKTLRERCYSYGRPLEQQEIKNIYKSQKEKTAHTDPLLEINTYHVTRMPSQLEYREEDSTMASGGIADLMQSADPDTDADPIDEDRDPRSIGNLLHAVMEKVNVATDLDISMRRMRVSGRITESQQAEWMPMLENAIGEANKRYGWFSGTLRVLNERPFLSSSSIIDRETGDSTHVRWNKRPDRIVVDEGGNATIIDFKFGMKTNVAKYRTQVADYIDTAMRSRMFRSVRGYLWYVRAGVFEEVTAHPPR